jgi:hypothetical protein
MPKTTSSIRFLLRVFPLALLLPLAACLRLDTEEEVRAQVKTWVFLAQTRTFVSKPTCTAAIFDTISPDVRSMAVRRVSSVRSGLRLIQEGRTVAFDVEGLTPNDVSQQMMSMNLSEGMGLVSSFIGPSRVCMDDQFQVDIYYALMQPESLVIYDPGSNALGILHRPSQIFFFLRGNV